MVDGELLEKMCIRDSPDTNAPAAETVEPTEPAVRYPLTDAERDVVERVVMAESGGESFEGQVLVAQDSF